MFKGFNNRQQHGFPNLNFRGDISAYGFGGVSFWLDAAFGLNTQTNLGAVSYWMPRVGASPFIQNTAGNQPRLILNDANYNNLPSVEAVDISRNMIAISGLKFDNRYTIAIISKVNTNVSRNGIIGNIISGDAGAVILAGGTGTGLTGFGYSTIGFTTPTLQGTTESTSSRIQIATNSNIIINGNIESTGSGFSIGQDLLTLFRGGGLSGGFPTNYLVGSIAEIIAFNYEMTSTNAIELSNNINQKYAIY